MAKYVCRIALGKCSQFLLLWKALYLARCYYANISTQPIVVTRRALYSQISTRGTGNVGIRGCSFKGRDTVPVTCPEGWEQK